ncbi:hypothetical protein Zmor_015414 [Zophobas morio]|uniref:Uncharacterized protein n=1 Tax=Zophobas morio TaxID=2755281 RepID=A0AA38MGI2_9CUCU|nr:hypothetical protein Zmor_015414 [Zophobas morio]
MAEGADTQISLRCVKCKIKAIKGPKCVSCGSIFHLSCAKLLNRVKFINDYSIKCCDSSDYQVNDVEYASADLSIPLSESQEIKYLKRIITEKDIVINQLREHNSLLKDHISSLNILEKFSGLINDSSSSASKNVKSDKANQGDRSQLQIKSKAYVNPKVTDPGVNMALNQLPTNSENETLPSETTHAAGLSLSLTTSDDLNTKQNLHELEELQKTVMNSLIDINNDVSNSHPIEDLVSNNQFKEVVYKKKRNVIKSNVKESEANPKKSVDFFSTGLTQNKTKPIIGTSNNRKLLSVLKKSTISIHLSRLVPATTERDILDYLGTLNKDVLCEKLVSKKPDVYSSFKIEVPRDLKKTLLSPSYWPEGVLVKIFFRRSTQQTIKP